MRLGYSAEVFGGIVAPWMTPFFAERLQQLQPWAGEKCGEYTYIYIYIACEINPVELW